MAIIKNHPNDFQKPLSNVTLLSFIHKHPDVQRFKQLSTIMIHPKDESFVNHTKTLTEGGLCP